MCKTGSSAALALMHTNFFVWPAFPLARRFTSGASIPVQNRRAMKATNAMQRSERHAAHSKSFSPERPRKNPAISLRSLKSQNEVKTLLSTSLSCYLPVMHPINLFYPWCGEGQLSDLLIYCNSAIARSAGPRVVTPTIARLGIAITPDPRVVESGRSNGSFALVLLTHFGGTFLHFRMD